MKKLFIYFFLCYALTAYADGVTKLYPSDKDFKDFPLTGWDNVSKALFIDKSNFSSAKIGDTIKVYGWDVASEGAKLFFGDYWIKPLPGSDMRSIPDAAHLPVKFCLTESMLYEILYGDNGNGRDLRIYGDHMQINRVELISCNSATVHESYRTIWKGLFEYADWTTLDLYKHAFDFIDLNNFRTLRLYHDANRSDNITIKLFKEVGGKWEQIAGVGTDVSITVTSTYAELTLTDDLRTTLSGLTNKLFVQGDKASGSAFNLTDIVLVPFDYEIANGASKELPTTVRNLTIHQGGSVSNADDITVTDSITYIYDAAGDAGAKLGQWYTFCLPFEASKCYVVEDGVSYPINAVYLTGEEEDDNEPAGTGYFYLQSFNGSGWDYIGNKGIPEKDTPYIIKFLNATEDNGKGRDLAEYFTANRSIKFVGRAQTINGTNDATGGSPSGDYSYHANKTLQNIELTHVFPLNTETNQFEYDYGSTSVIAPFECYIKASTPARALAKPRLALRPRGSKEQTEIATAMDNIADSTAQIQKILYNGQVVIMRDNKMYNVLGQEL